MTESRSGHIVISHWILVNGGLYILFRSTVWLFYWCVKLVYGLMWILECGSWKAFLISLFLDVYSCLMDLFKYLVQHMYCTCHLCLNLSVCHQGFFASTLSTSLETAWMTSWWAGMMGRWRSMVSTAPASPHCASSMWVYMSCIKHWEVLLLFLCQFIPMLGSNTEECRIRCDRHSIYCVWMFSQRFK